MEVENVTTITLTGRDTRLAMTNSGLRVDLPAGTVAVVIRVGQEPDKESEKEPL